MPILNLAAKTPEQRSVKEYLEKSASETLADKINRGVKIQKDGKTVINKKDLDGFMKFACEEARKKAEKSAKSTCIEDSTVYGWAIHYFEETSIEGTLYNEDGTEYKPVQHSVTRSPAPAVSPIPPVQKPKPQMSIFEMMEQKSDDTETDSDEETEDETEETEDEIEPLPETKENLPEEPQPASFPAKVLPNAVSAIPPQSSPFYQRYMKLQAQYPDTVCGGTAIFMKF